MREEIPLALTFDDVLIRPGYAEIHPNKVDVSTRLCKNIELSIPIISAAMDTVTEARLAIALAQEGGIGVIHRNLSIERQVEEVLKVKRSEAGMITNPVTLHPEDTISKAVEAMNKFNISGLPVVDEGKKLVGILTNRDIRFETNFSKKVKEVMTTDVITASPNTILEKAKEILHKYRIEKLPVVDNEGKLVGLITVKDIKKMQDFPLASKDRLGRLLVAAAIGTGADFLERAQSLVKAEVDILVIDSSHAYSKKVLKSLEKLKDIFPNVPIIAGNVATSEGAKALIERGADAIKVGIGPGSICTTRVITGSGVPQITALIECSKVSREYNIPVISDGGIKFSGDITKALAAGASSVMIGSLFAGTEESPGETILYQGRTYKAYRGMGSLSAMAKGSADRYFQEDNLTKMVPEGIEGMVPYKGTLHSMVYQLIGGLKAGIGLAGCRNIQELQRKAKFIRISNAGLRESHAHDVIITNEAPNYWVEK